jgi:hypothetical protein
MSGQIPLGLTGRRGMPLLNMMVTISARSASRLGCQVLLGAALAAAVTVLAPEASSAAIATFGSPLAVPATLNTAEDLNYPGTNTAVPASPEAPHGYVHTYHFGADAALWSLAQAKGTPRAPATGQALKVSLEGCAVPASDGTPPLTQIHFQALSPLPGGGAKVNLTSQAFDIPVCGVAGASGTTVTAYNPVNLCVSQGDYVAFNEEGGFVGHSYQSGVPYRVLGRVAGSNTASFIRGAGTNNGALLSSSDSSAMDGYSVTGGEELMMQVTLGTGANATHVCPGGKQGLPPKLPPIRVSPQTEGVNRHGFVAVAFYCRITPCRGIATLSRNGEHVGHTGFSLPGGKTYHLPIHVTSKLVRMARRYHGVSADLSAVVAGSTVTQTIIVKI